MYRRQLVVLWRDETLSVDQQLYNIQSHRDYTCFPLRLIHMWYSLKLSYVHLCERPWPRDNSSLLLISEQALLVSVPACNSKLYVWRIPLVLALFRTVFPWSYSQWTVRIYSLPYASRMSGPIQVITGLILYDKTLTLCMKPIYKNYRCFMFNPLRCVSALFT